MPNPHIPNRSPKSSLSTNSVPITTNVITKGTGLLPSPSSKRISVAKTNNFNPSHISTASTSAVPISATSSVSASFLVSGEEISFNISSAAASSSSTSSSFSSNNPSSSSILPTKKDLISSPRIVIHDKLLRHCLLKELKYVYDPSTLPGEDDIDLRTIQSLILSYENIGKIDHLHGFNQLTKLQLDNNHIEKIEHLDHLINLTWLDLSFNSITKIEGLEKLTRLTDLSLTNNQITELENLAALSSTLQVLSIGYNKLHDLAQIKQFRQFQKLRLLHLKGNTFSSHEEYTTTVFAFLPQLQYFDYLLIESSQFDKARDNKLDQLLILESKELEIEVEMAKQKEISLRDEKDSKANIERIHYLFDDMYCNDNDHIKLKQLPNYNNLIQQYKDTFNIAITEYESMILSKSEEKAQEKSQVEEATQFIINKSEEESKQLIKEYCRQEKTILQGFHGYVYTISNSDRSDNIIAIKHCTYLLDTLTSSLGNLYTSLMTIEMNTVNSIQLILDEFDKLYSRMSAEICNKTSTFFRKLIENSHTNLTNVNELVFNLNERLIKEGDGNNNNTLQNNNNTNNSNNNSINITAGNSNNPSNPIPQYERNEIDNSPNINDSTAINSTSTPSSSASASSIESSSNSLTNIDSPLSSPPSLDNIIKSILLDKETLLTSINTSHDCNDSKILSKEDDIRDREENECKLLLLEWRNKELKRNRTRVNEIYEFRRKEEEKIFDMRNQIPTDDEESGEEEEETN